MPFGLQVVKFSVTLADTCMRRPCKWDSKEVNVLG